MSFTAVIKRPIIKKNLVTILKFIILFSLVYYLYTSLDLSSIYSSALNADLFLLISALLMLPLNLLLQYYKWNLSCKLYLDESDTKRIWTSLFAGFAAAIFTPARTGEYIGRGIEFHDKKISSITAAVFIDKLFTLIFVVLFGTAGAAVIIPSVFQFYYIIPLIIFISVLVFAAREIIKRKFSQIRIPDYKFSLHMSFLSFFFYICYLIQFVLLISAFTNSSNYLLFFCAAGLIMFVKTMIPNFISGEFGIRESASVFFLTLIGENASAAFNASLFLFIINIVLPSLAGIIPLMKRKNV
jgi:uncharacterized membrane protein YbhN (UPF0104 family)